MATGRITQASVARIRPGKADAFTWDTQLIGFGLKVAAGGRKSFVVQYRTAGGRRGRVRRITLGTVESLTVESARKLAKRTLGDVAHGSDPAAARASDRTAELVREILPIYLDELGAKKKARTVTEWSRLWQRDLLPALGKLRVRDLTTDVLARLHLEMRKRPVLANRALGAVSAFLVWCERRGYRERGTNPARGVERFREKARERYLTGEELRRLGEALSKAETIGLPPAPNLKKRPKSAATAKHATKRSKMGPFPADPFAVAAIRFLAFSGFREQEALSLRWDAIDFDRSSITLDESKSGRSVRALGAAARDILSGLPRMADNPFVFPGAKAGKHRVEIRRVWAAVREAAKLHDVRQHDLRHTVASFAISGGASLALVGSILGHRDMRSAQRYAHLIEQARHEAADRTAGDIASAMQGAQTPVTPIRKTGD